jgi:glycine cleavage system aminomethyltransferase T
VGSAAPPGGKRGRTRRRRAAPEPGQELLINGETLGHVTSATLPPGWPHAVALAYLKRKSSSPTVDLSTAGGTVRARIVELPFDLSHP